jgi:hypothetical protein
MSALGRITSGTGNWVSASTGIIRARLRSLFAVASQLPEAPGPAPYFAPTESSTAGTVFTMIKTSPQKVRVCTYFASS